MSMLENRPRLTRPGLFVTGTDTGVGKTVVTCAIAWHLRRSEPVQPSAGSRGCRVGVLKPIATGCRRDREGLVSEDAEALAHFADCREPLEVINPVRYRQPVAPAVASQMTSRPVDRQAVTHSLERLDANCDVLLVEGIGGLLVPLDSEDPRCTVIDLIVSVGFPVLVVGRSGLGTLNHTAMTVRLLEAAGCRIAGLVVNGFVADSSSHVDAKTDASVSTNRPWLEKMNQTSVLATIPACPADQVQAQRGRLPQAILDAMGVTYWPGVVGKAR